MLAQSRLPAVKPLSVFEAETDNRHSYLDTKRLFCRQEYGLEYNRASVGHNKQIVGLRGKTKGKDKDTLSNIQNGVDSKYHARDDSAVLHQPSSGSCSWLSPFLWRNKSGQKVAKWPIRDRQNSATNDTSGEDWRSLSQALGTRQKFSSISNHDLMRIAELRLSSDMQEEDSGSQVMLLQKALFWLGHLPTESSVTGYFCTKTKQSLCDFQEGHGVNPTGIWGALSKQALWHTISGEILHRVAEEKAHKKNNNTVKADKSVAMQLSQIWSPVNFSDAFTAEVSGTVLLIIGVLLGVIVSRFYANHSTKEKPVRRRVISPKEEDNHPLLTRNVNTATTSDNGLTTSNKLSSTKDVENNPHKRKSIRDPLPLNGDRHGMPNISAMSFMPYRIGRKIMSSSVKPVRQSLHSKSPGDSGRTAKPNQTSVLSMDNQSKKTTSKNLLESSSEVTRNAQREDNIDLKGRIEDLKKAVEEAEQNGQAAVKALAEERKRSIELEEKISRQRQSAAALEEEVRVLKESHDVLLESIRKKKNL